MEQIINNFTDAPVKLSVASKGDKEVFDGLYEQYREDRVTLNIAKLEDKRTGKYMTLSTTGFLVMFIMLGASLITTFIHKEKRTRTYYRICSAPVNAGQYIVANAITGLLIVMVQIIIMLLAMRFVFHIDTGVRDTLMFAILFMFGIVAIGTGLLVTAFSSSSYMAGTLGTLIMTPTCMLGGCFWSIDMMPDIMQKIGYFVPQRWAMDAVLKLQSGGEQGDIVINLVILAAFAAALLLTAIFRFSRTQNLQKFV